MQRRRYKRYAVSPVFTQFGLSRVSWEKLRVGVKIRAETELVVLLVSSWSWVSCFSWLSCWNVLSRSTSWSLDACWSIFLSTSSRFLYREGNPDLITFYVLPKLDSLSWKKDRCVQVLAVSVLGRGTCGEKEWDRQMFGTWYDSMRERPWRPSLAFSSSDLRMVSRASCSSSSPFSLSAFPATVCSCFLNAGSSFSWKCTMASLRDMKEKNQWIDSGSFVFIAYKEMRTHCTSIGLTQTSLTLYLTGLRATISSLLLSVLSRTCSVIFSFSGTRCSLDCKTLMTSCTSDSEGNDRRHTGQQGPLCSLSSLINWVYTTLVPASRAKPGQKQKEGNRNDV